MIAIQPADTCRKYTNNLYIQTDRYYYLRVKGPDDVMQWCICQYMVYEGRARQSDLGAEVPSGIHGQSPGLGMGALYLAAEAFSKIMYTIFMLGRRKCMKD